MNEELKYAFDRFSSAFIQLKEGVNIAEDDLERDGVIQRFEFTFELLWKTIKIFLREKGIEVKTPKDSLKEGFRLGWIGEEQVFLNMLEDRNKTSHIYEKSVADEIFSRIKVDYINAIESVFGKLKDVK